MKSKPYTASADQLVYDYGPLVSAICRRMMQDEEIAREAAQEITGKNFFDVVTNCILAPLI